jgi:hypothetical protein
MGDIDGFRHETDLDQSPSYGRLSPQYGTNTSIAYAENVAGKLVRVHNTVSGNYGAYSTDGGVTWTAFSSFPPVRRAAETSRSLPMVIRLYGSLPMPLHFIQPITELRGPLLPDFLLV